jgi:hypothetical protein
MRSKHSRFLNERDRDSQETRELHKNEMKRVLNEM